LESFQEPEPVLSHGDIQDRTQTTREELRRIVKDYLDNDSSLLDLVDRIVKDGNEGLRMVAADDASALERNPLAVEGLEAIVQTDGSRPSFLISDGDIDRASSPVGTWAERLDKSAEQLRAAIASVGRIDVPGSALGYQGTGFLIQQDLILTNRHVLQVSAHEESPGNWKFVHGVAIDFGHEKKGRESVNRRQLKRLVFCGSKPIDFNNIDHAKLDVALIELEPRDTAAIQPGVFSLDLAPDWAQPRTIVYTIGYPGPPADWTYPPTLLEQLFQKTYGYKRLAPGEIIPAVTSVSSWTLAHDATTLGGNSGSIVLKFGSEGLAAGIHYGGRRTDPRENWGHVLGSVLDQTDGHSSRTLREILTGYGVRLPTESTRPVHVPPSVARPIERPTEAPIPRPPERPEPRPSKPSGDWRLGVTLAMMKPLAALPGANRLEALEAAGDGVTAAESLADRRGYASDFLGDWDIPFPFPSRDMRRIRRGGEGVVLKYEHFSVIMSESRRLPLITGSNINGTESRRLPRVTRWNYDGRLDQADQWGNELYQGNDVDRGHMVRREDPVWGALAVAKRANVDTFHYTNSCPQMAGVNQVTWLGLEDYILSHTRDDNMRVSVFTGPVFTDEDFAYRGALIPKSFWKIVAFITEDGRPSATAYKVSQARELQELEFVFAAYKTFQISVQQVMDATGIDFSALLPYDGFSQHERVHGVPVVERLERLDQIKV
jgi:endonuclease G